MTKKERLFELCLIGITFVLILITEIIFKQSFFRTLPLYISLVVMIVQSRASSVGFLMGGINAILYGCVYFSYALYASAIQAILVSFPIQLITYFNWRKRPYGNSTVFRKLSTKQRIIGTVLLIVVWVGMTMGTSAAGGSYGALDSASSLLGTLSIIFSMFAFLEYSYFWVGGSVLSIVLYITMLKTSPEQITYLISNVFSTICATRTLINVHKLYNKQQEEKNTITAQNVSVDNTSK